MWDPEIWQSAREGKKLRPLGYYDYTVKLSIPAHLIFSILKKRAPEWRPFLWEDSLGGKCAFPDTQISQSARAAPKVARIRDQIDEQIDEQKFPKVDQKGDPAGLSARHR